MFKKLATIVDSREKKYLVHVCSIYSRKEFRFVKWAKMRDEPS
jgi:hypothetical protein